jgi:hypothetical protein
VRACWREVRTWSIGSRTPWGCSRFSRLCGTCTRPKQQFRKVSERWYTLGVDGEAKREQQVCDGFPSASLSGPQVVSPQASAGQFSRQAICGGLNADLQDGGQGRLPETTPGDTLPATLPSTSTVSRHVRAQRTACTIGETAPHSEDVLAGAFSQRQTGVMSAPNVRPCLQKGATA